MEPTWTSLLDGLRTSVGLAYGAVTLVVVLRLFLALVLCGLIGIERSNHERAAGFRPHILVGVGACMMTMVGAYGFSDVTVVSRDPMRLASYVIASIGFLGAGAILRHGTMLRGLTTAATLWASAGIGIAVGAGMGGLAVVVAALILFTLISLKRLETRLWTRSAVEDLVIALHDDNRSVGKTLEALDRLGVPVRRATVEPGAGTTAVLRVNLAQPLRADQMLLLSRRLLSLKYVEHVETIAYHIEDQPPLLSEANPEALSQGEPEVMNLSDETVLGSLDEDYVEDERTTR